MLTDKKKLTKLFDEFGIPYTEDPPYKELYPINLSVGWDLEEEEIVGGYMNFWCEFMFTKDGKFKKVVIAE